MFTYRLILKDGSPADPPTFDSTPTWRAGDGASSTPPAASASLPSATQRSLLSVSSDWTDSHQGTLEGSRARLQAA